MANAMIVKPGDSIQNAIDSLPTEGGSIELMSGVYFINEPIRINKSNIIINGTHQSVLSHGNDSFSMFLVPDNFTAGDPPPIKLRNITFKGFSIISNYSFGSANYDALIQIYNADNITMENIFSTAQPNRVMTINAQDPVLWSENVSIKDNEIYYSSVSFLFSGNVTVTNNTFIDFNRAFSIDSNRNNMYVYIYKNNISNSGGNGGIKLYVSSYQYAYDNKISGGQRGIGIWCGPSNVVIYNNTITGATVAGIEIKLQFKLANISVRNNFIYNNNAPGILTLNYESGLTPDNFFAVNITNNVIYNNYEGITTVSPYVTLNTKNNIISNNIGYGINHVNGTIFTAYNDVWNNALGNYNNTSPGTGDISADPLFADSSAGDFHLKSQAGRWNGTAWVTDAVTSPAIDAGDPSSDYVRELRPNGGRVNMGTYGNTPEASMSISGPTIVSYFPQNSSPAQNNGSTYQFNVSTNQLMNTNAWLLDGIVMASGSQNYNITWTHASIYNLTYSGSNGNGSVSMTWNVSVSDIDTTPPTSIGSLQNTTNVQSYISWSWTDPADADFSRVMIYIDGIFMTNVTKGVQYYNASGLSPDTSYTISTHTVDTTGNVNMTWTNHTARTAPAPTPTPTPSPTPTPTPTPTAVYDNRLREGSPDAVLGGNTYIDIGQITGTGRYRDVIWFNLSAYNSTDKITSAMLSLFWYYPLNARNNSTTVEIYRPLDWDQSYVNWNNRTYNTPWSSQGGDWFDKNNAAQGNVPYASVTFGASTLADNRYYGFDVTELVQGYVDGTYSNTGFFLKAKDENDNYIAFYSLDWSNASQIPGLAINYTTFTPDAEPPESIASLLNTTHEKNFINWTWSDPSDADFSRVMVYLNGSFITNVSKGVQFYNATGLSPDTSYIISTHTVDTSGNINQSWVNHTARTAPLPDTTPSPDVNLDGVVDIADLVIVAQRFGETTTAPYPRYDVNADGKVDILDITLVSSKIT